MVDRDFMAPNFDISISGSTIGEGLRDLVSSIEYESVDGIADEARFTIANPDFVLTDTKLWQPGQEMDISMGYGNNLSHIGRVIIARPKVNFPRGGTMPTITVKGYTKDFLMMKNKPKRDEADIRNFEVENIEEAVARVASRPAYAFDTILIDPTPGLNVPAQKADVTDYDYVKGLANKLGWIFWVDYTLDLGWTLHFNDPAFLAPQERIYTFQYNAGDNTTLYDFEPELALTDSITTLQVQSRNEETGEVYVEEFSDSDEPPQSKALKITEKVLDGQHTTGGAVIKLFFGDYAVDIVSDKKFKSAIDMKVWAEQWFRRKRENFVLGRGSMIGIEDVFSRQSHNLKGLGNTFDGKYNFVRVRHALTPGSAYELDFTARKELTG